MGRGGKPVAYQKRILGLVKGPLAPVFALAAIITAWEIWVHVKNVPQFLLPAPSAIAQHMMSAHGVLWHHAQFTTVAALLGFSLAVVFAVAMATLMVWSRTFENAVYPLLVGTQVIPKVAIAPLLVVYLGFNLAPKVFLAFLLSFFPMVVNTTLGMKSVSPELLELLATLRANRLQVLIKVRVKKALPYFLEGAKVGITLAVIGVVVAELVAGNRGLGFLVTSATSSLQTVVAFSSMIWLVAIGIILFETIHIGGRKLMPWHDRDT